MTPEEFKEQLRQTMEDNKGKVMPLPAAPTDGDIGKHIERVRMYALEHPCVFDEDFLRIFGEGRNRALFNYRRSWLVSILVSVSAAEDFSKFFWQVSTALISAHNGQARSLALLPAQAKEQLMKSRTIVMRDVSDLAAGGADFDAFSDRQAFHACCDLSNEELAIAKEHMTAEQRVKMGF